MLIAIHLKWFADGARSGASVYTSSHPSGRLEQSSSVYIPITFLLFLHVMPKFSFPASCCMPDISCQSFLPGSSHVLPVGLVVPLYVGPGRYSTETPRIQCTVPMVRCWGRIPRYCTQLNDFQSLPRARCAMPWWLECGVIYRNRFKPPKRRSGPNLGPLALGYAKQRGAVQYRGH